MNVDNRQLNADRTFGHCQVLTFQRRSREFGTGSVNRVILIPEVRLLWSRRFIAGNNGYKDLTPTGSHRRM